MCADHAAGRPGGLTADGGAQGGAPRPSPVRTGILGGTFDPVHLGHLASAREVAAAHGLGRVLLVLSARPPHKPGGPAASADARWRMLQLAVAEDTARHGASVVLEPCDVELRRDAPSWTVDTLRELSRARPGEELVLILGIDAWNDVDTWSRPGELLELASVIVTSRPGHDDGHDDAQFAPAPPVAAREASRYDPAIGAWVHTSGHTLTGHRIRGLEVSATEIRRRVREGLPVAHLTGDAVARYLTEHGTYRGAPGAAQPAAQAADDGAIDS